MTWSAVNRITTASAVPDPLVNAMSIGGMAEITAPTYSTNVRRPATTARLTRERGRPLAMTSRHRREQRVRVVAPAHGSVDAEEEHDDESAHRFERRPERRDRSRRDGLRIGHRAHLSRGQVSRRLDPDALEGGASSIRQTLREL